MDLTSNRQMFIICAFKYTVQEMAKNGTWPSGSAGAATVFLWNHIKSLCFLLYSSRGVIFYYTHFHHITELVTCYKEYKGTKPCVSFLGDFLILIGSWAFVQNYEWI